MVFSLGTDKAGGGLMISPQSQSNSYTDDKKDDLSSKYSISLGDLSPGEAAIRNALDTGTVDRYGQLLEQQKALKLADTRNSIIQQLATKDGGPNELDLDVIRGLSMEDIRSPNLNSILEEEYSRKALNLSTTLLNNDSGVLDESFNADPNTTMDVMDRTQNVSTRNFIASNIYNETMNKYNQSNLLQKGLAWAQVFVPFRSWQQMQGFVKQAPFSSVLPGESIEAQISYLNTLPPDEFKDQLQEAVDSALSFGNYLDALTFLEAVQSYSHSDKGWQDIFAGLDVASVVPVSSLTKVLKGTTRAATMAVKDTTRIAKEVGLDAEAVKGSFAESLAKGKLPADDITNITDVEKSLPSLFRPTEAFTEGLVKSVDAAALNRLQVAAEARAGKALEIITDVNRVERLDAGELEQAYQEAEDTMRELFTHQNHQIINVERNAAEDSISNTHSVTVSMGQKNGNPFRSKKAAENFAQFVSLKTNDYAIEQVGNGWVVKVTRNVDETTGGVRNLTIATDSKTPDTFVTRFLGAVAGADLKLSREQTIARGVATLSAEHMSGMLDELTAPLASLKGKQRDEFELFLKSSRDFVDGKTGLRGVSYNTAHEFENAFAARTGHAPSEAQIDAYMAFKQAYDLDWLIRDADVYKQKAIRGIESMRLKFADSTLNFEGKVIDDLPRGSETPFTVGVVHNGEFVGRAKGSKYPTWKSNNMTATDWERLQAYLDDGFRIIQPYEGRLELRGTNVNFILARDFQRNRVGMLKLNYREGSRVIQKYPHYVKQAKVSVDEGEGRYFGDVSVANARTSEEAKIIEDRLEQARIRFKNNSSDFDKYVKDNLPMYEPAHLRKLFQEGTLNPNVPFKAVHSGVRVNDAMNLREALRREGLSINSFYTDDDFDLSRQVTGRFLGERGETNMATYKVEDGTILKMDTDPLLSPFDTLRVSLGDMIDTHVVHDYRIKSAWDYTKEFGDILDGTEADFQTNGLGFIYNPKYKTGADPNKVRIAEGVRKSILALFNNKTIVERQLDTYKEKLANTVRSLVGDGTADWIQDSRIFQEVSNADKWMRSFAFHSKMGFFNIKQLFLQSSAVINAVSISPTHGVRGARVLAPLRMALYAPSERILKGIANRQTVSGFAKEEFLELVDAYKRSGFGNVGGDVAYLDDLSPPNLRKGKFGQALDMGAAFFKEGERISRTVAFATAYSERKALLKGKPLRRADEAWVLQRAKDLTGNMTRDSNAGWQKGYGAIATQFFGFQMRLMEQFIGKKLTTAEKARLFAGMSLVYGVPVASGMVIGVAPVREMLKDWLAENGVQYDDTLAEPFIDGFASQLLEMATGMDLNVSERFGPGGLTTFYDLFKGDASFNDLLLGASGGIIGDTIADTDPLLKGIWASLDGNDQTNFPITIEDLIEPLRNISTVNNAVKLNESLNLGKWVSQNENILTDVSPTEAVVSSILGLDPERVSDAYNQIEAIQAIKGRQNSLRKEMIADYRRGIQALRDKNTDDAERFFSRVKARGVLAGFTLRQMAQIYRDAANEEPLDANVARSFNEYVLKRVKP